VHRPALLLHGYGMATDAFEHHELFQGPARHRRLHMQCCLCVWGGGRGRGGGGKKVVLFVTNCVE
jgi:hypothetical protein